MSAAAQTSASQVLSGPKKLAEVTRLMQILEVDLEKKNLLPPIRNATLEQLKPHTRALENADPVRTVEGIKTLCRHSFDGNSFVTSRAAMKCLANIMLLDKATRQIFVDLGYAPKAADRLRSDNREDEFLASRLLFLTTYETNINFESLFEEKDLAESINTNLCRHSKRLAKSTHPPADLDTLALSETLKLLFNVTQFYPDHAPAFTKSILYILKILANTKIETLPLKAPVTWLINALLNLDLEDRRSRHFAQNPFFPLFDTKCNVNHLIAILDGAVRQYTDEELEQNANPLVSCLRRIYSFAPESIRVHMRELLLPSNEERNQPLGKSDSLSAYLLRLSTSPVAPNLRETVSNLLFELSDRDAKNFVRNVGYGFASGFLMTHDLPVPQNATEAWSMIDDGDQEGLVRDPGEMLTNVNGVEINPVTGQRLDMEPQKPGPDMTDEEKEREAEKLFVLFERLRATGVVNVENPVIRAMQEGRFEEIKDEDDDDDDD